MNGEIEGKMDKKFGERTETFQDEGIQGKIKINYLTIQKMAFLYNALEEGWKISKENDKYIFVKKHQDKKEVFLDSYLQKFLNENMDINKIKA
jgi:hypothetical protein